MKPIFLIVFILNLFVISIPVMAASGVTNSTQSKIEGTMKKTDKAIKEGNTKLKEELQSLDKKNEHIQKKLEDYKKIDNVNSRK